MFHVKHYLLSKTRRTEISEGETPEIREACPIVRGFILDNFCLASEERDCKE